VSPSVVRESRVPIADVWAIGILFLLSRLAWVISYFYYSDERATAFAALTCLAALLVGLAGYAFLRLVSPSMVGLLARALVLAIFLYVVALQLRPIVARGVVLSMYSQFAIAAAGLALAGLSAARVGRVWQRVRTALIATALIGTISSYLFAALFAPRIELLGNSGALHRPVVVLLLDEFSAGAARDLTDDLAKRGLHVDARAVPSIGTNTIDAIPTMLSGIALLDARPCTHSAVCGRGRVLDFARLGVARDDVDIVGVYHRYCAIRGLRQCVIPTRGLEGSILGPFLCGLPLHLLIGAQLECDRPGYSPRNAAAIAAATRGALLGAPFWSRGGLLYAHVLEPHPPSPGGERRLADAYAANLARARTLVQAVVDRLERSPFRDDFSLVITSDHHLRSEYWCTVEPYATGDCTLPESWSGPNVPFIVATRGPPIAHRAPRSNADLLPIVVELSKAR
jgi:hypothetical protein